MQNSDADWGNFLKQRSKVSVKYGELAELAARAERGEKWEEGAELWQQAALLAKTPENYDWAERRGEACRKKVI